LKYKKIGRALSSEASKLNLDDYSHCDVKE